MKKQHPPPNEPLGERKGAFTLIELLVCLGIVLLLGALIVLSISLSGPKADQLRCQNNLRQHGVALALFLSEKNFYPLYMNPGQTVPDQGASFLDSLRSHGLGPLPSDSRSANSVYFCPAFMKQIRPDPGLNELVALYGYNMDGLNAGGTNSPLGLGLNIDPASGTFSPVNESLIIAPSSLLAMGDGVMGWNQTYQDSAAFVRRATAQNHLGSTERVKRRHGGHLNVLFCDGHVNKETLQFLFGDTSGPALSSWNRDNQPHLERVK